MPDSPCGPNVPEHIDEAVRSVTQLHSDHHGDQRSPTRGERDHRVHCAAPLCRSCGVERRSMDCRQPHRGHARPPSDRRTRVSLAARGGNLLSMFVVMLVLVAQKHEDELNAHRDTLTLELAILSEHKIAKVWSFWRDCVATVRMFRIASIARLIRWRSPRTPHRSSRLRAQTSAHVMFRPHLQRRAQGTNAAEQMRNARLGVYGSFAADD